MKYAAKGAKEHNGITVGILPEDELAFANKYIDIKIPTGMGYARNVIVVRSSGVVIAIEGSTGTLTEMAHTTNENRPLIVLRDTGGICEFISENEFEFLDSKIADTPQGAVKMAIDIIRSKK